MTPTKSAADYAAVAIAPLLIFLMISSLANFLMLILYRGGFPQRVSWTLLMFTLGAVGIARVAIERDRAYALGYAGILGFAAFFAMLRFVDSPIFSAFILAVIAYLSDVIVRDCTLIDDTVDASGQGLIDSGRLFVKKQIEQDRPSETVEAAAQPGRSSVEDEKSASGETDAAVAGPQKNAHQPGRTVMYLALAALPLFGLGQFFLHNDADTWARAQWLLALYLFSSFSLLVTTSFLGLRRYLRQRHVEMPGDVSIGWLAGGLAMIAIVLLIAFIAPLPGKTLASFELPRFLDSPGGTEASRFGWGGEGADKSRPDAPKTTSDPNADQKEVESMTAQQGAPPGDVGDGSRDQGPAGKQDGGKQQSGGESNQQHNSGNQGQPSPSQQESSQQPSGQQQSGQQQSGQQQSGQQQSGQQPSGQQPSGQQSPNQQGDQDPGGQPKSQSGSQQSQQSRDGDSKSQPRDDASANQDGENQEPSSGQQPSQRQQDQQQQDLQDQQARQAQQAEQEQPRSSGLPPEGSPSSPPSSSPGVMESLADAASMFASLIKFVIFLVLAGIVGTFVWMNRHLIGEWWNKLFGAGDQPAEEFDEFIASVTQVPPRAFASFRNPIGKESDLRRIVVITFQAFDAWTREHGTPRGKDETPAEFIRRVAPDVPQMSTPATQVVDAYNRIVYGRGQATGSDLSAAEKVWHMMQSQA